MHTGESLALFCAADSTPHTKEKDFNRQVETVAPILDLTRRLSTEFAFWALQTLPLQTNCLIGDKDTRPQPLAAISCRDALQSVSMDAIVAAKERHPSWGCPPIAQQIAWAFGVAVDKDVVRRVLARHYQPRPDASGPSWLTFLGHLKDSLLSVDLFRCESAVLRTRGILVVMDPYTRRMMGFGLHAGAVNGMALGRMFNHAIGGHRSMPNYLSSDHDPVYRSLQPAHPGGDRNQDRALRSWVPSLGGAADRPAAPRVLGSYVVVDKR